MTKLIPVLLNYLWCWIYWSSVLSQYSMVVKGKSTQTRWPGFESWPYQVILLFCASVSWSVVLGNWCPLLLKNLILSIFIFISFWDYYYWMPAHLLLASISFSFSFAFPISLSFTKLFFSCTSPAIYTIHYLFQWLFLSKIFHFDTFKIIFIWISYW